MKIRRFFVALLVLSSLLGGPAKDTLAQDQTFDDPFAYCAAVGTIDAPDARYIGPPMPESLARGLQSAMGVSPDAPLDPFLQNSFWRCMDGRVYACTVGADLPCQEQADTSKDPSPEIANYCQANPNAAVIPAVVTGRRTVYEWSCANGTAVAGRQFAQPDARGFLDNIWYAISPQALPGTGGISDPGSAMIMLILSMAALTLGLGLRRRASM